MRGGDAGLSKPVAADNQLAVLAYPVRGQIRAVLPDFAQSFPSGFVGDDNDSEHVMLKRQL